MILEKTNPNRASVFICFHVLTPNLLHIILGKESHLFPLETTRRRYQCLCWNKQKKKNSNNALILLILVKSLYGKEAK